ncbi:mannose-1-phosphate guanylyltransferase/mannose-6-phosphate isomerase [Pseudothauera nasutitermitis]|uniref:mannose-1-phosphate guanylyltransferase n=1 Tax=Pseudothauera nasutitermitis TaxID=2565930 RepID=A0A4S4B2F2_9RHOO|nr:mannose-1-phosphate guanylyltransferase/mannose-6-phosphate isomerase [Pseudothauera nasutitermitis]THF66820.1 mannose-1-phosphate guanylyltransferase/mannose-6-phosphate isomerase [Pseudothauera nasutitermitis]
MKVQPVILCGGAGTRLWPMSRDQHPKQLLSLLGERTLLQATVGRVEPLGALLEVERSPIVVCNEAYRFITAEQLRQAGVPQPTILLEPAGRNTAPALTLAALQVERQAEDALLLVMPADHLIDDSAAFADAVLRAAECAAAGAVLTFGIRPRRAETGYGYLQVERDDGGSGVPLPVLAFVEKPDAPTAERYMEDGSYLWNSGIFLLRASVWLRAMERFAPDILAQCRKAIDAAQADMDFIRVASDVFTACRSESIDYAVMERLSGDAESGIDIAVVPMEAGWSDVGTWDALWEAAPRDDEDNALRGDVLAQDTEGCLVQATHRMVACVGVRDLIVVETADAVLVARRGSGQGLREVVARLKAEGRTQYAVHRKIHRPWGCYDAIDAGERFQVKHIIVEPGATLSLQMHHHRAEHWVVVRGTAKVTRGDESFLLAENESTYIPIGVHHRLENPGKLPLELIEVQSGSYLGEDDIVRLEDYYGRD